MINFKTATLALVLTSLLTAGSVFSMNNPGKDSDEDLNGGSPVVRHPYNQVIPLQEEDQVEADVIIFGNNFMQPNDQDNNYYFLLGGEGNNVLYGDFMDMDFQNLQFYNQSPLQSPKPLLEDKDIDEQ